VIRAVLLSLLFALPFAGRAAETSADVVAEMNLARTQPQMYAQIVAQRAPSLGNSPRAIEEAVRFLKKQHPAAPLTVSQGLSQAALSHVLDTGMRGSKGHRGSDGSNVANRASRFGRWDVRIGENIFYGRIGARDAVVALIVDEGVRDRYHRYNIFEKAFRFAGAAVGPHAGFGSMVVTDFAAVYQEGTGSRTAGL
jgi:uncharacterized protein YkwD